MHVRKILPLMTVLQRFQVCIQAVRGLEDPKSKFFLRICVKISARSVLFRTVLGGHRLLGATLGPVALH